MVCRGETVESWCGVIIQVSLDHCSWATTTPPLNGTVVLRAVVLRGPASSQEYWQGRGNRRESCAERESECYHRDRHLATFSQVYNVPKQGLSLTFSVTSQQEQLDFHFTCLSTFALHNSYWTVLFSKTELASQRKLDKLWQEDSLDVKGSGHYW